MHPIKFTTSQMSGCSSFSKAEDQKSAAKHRNRAFGRTAHRAGHFQDALLQYWVGRCPLTGISEPELLRASH
jgi:hypothetical protein